MVNRCCFLISDNGIQRHCQSGRVKDIVCQSKVEDIVSPADSKTLSVRQIQRHCQSGRAEDVVSLSGAEDIVSQSGVEDIVSLSGVEDPIDDYFFNPYLSSNFVIQSLCFPDADICSTTS
jgi:hypothetical protein